MRPVQALELVRGLPGAIQETSPEAQREVVLRVVRRIAIQDDQVVDVDLNPIYAETFRWYLRPQPDEFRTQSEYKRGALACCRTSNPRLTDAQRTVIGRLAGGRQAKRINFATRVAREPSRIGSRMAIPSWWSTQPVQGDVDAEGQESHAGSLVIHSWR
jgi:hypothetical protein